MRTIALIGGFMAAFVSLSMADDLRPPLEKQFFDFFAGQCADGLVAEAKSMNMDPKQPNVADGITRYCACTSQAIVSHLTAAEIIAFANDATRDPAAGKMKPYFKECHGT
jgi:hypothetical protein